MQTYGMPDSATSRSIWGSALPPDTSLTRRAPAAIAGSATAARIVSTLTQAPVAASSAITGITRRSSSETSGRTAPGLVDSPPTSTMSAPSFSKSMP